MSRRRYYYGVIFIASVLLFAGVGLHLAQEPDMEAMMKLAQPGEHHKMLAMLEGTWKTQGTFWMVPGAPPTKSDGISKNTMIMGGRFLQSELKADFMGTPFTGLGIDGYDNASQKHIGTWMDSMGTMIMSSEGTCSDDHKVRTMISEFQDPATGKPMKMKQVITIVDSDKYIFEAYMVTSEGEVKAMEIIYTR